MSSRIAHIPIDHIIAEMAAFPLASNDALELGLTELSPLLRDETGELWRRAERHLLGGSPAFSVDEAVASRDALWFHHDPASPLPTRDIPLHQYVDHLAQEYLEIRGSTATPRCPESSDIPRQSDCLYKPLARRAWWWLTVALPPDLLLAARYDGGHRPDCIVPLSPALAQHLHDAGYAETHLHLGAAIDFPLLWVAALVRIADSNLEPDAFSGPGAELNEGRLLGPWLIRAAIARYVLAAYLAWGPPWERTFPKFVNSDVRQRLGESHDLTGYLSLWEVFSELRRGQLAESDDIEFDFAQLQAVYRRLTGVSVNNLQRIGRDYWRTDQADPGIPHELEQESTDEQVQVDQADPIYPLFPQTSYSRSTAEVRFTAAALAYLREHQGDQADPMFSQLFWQVVRIRGIFYRHVVQRPMTPGLQWFIRFYARLSPPKRPLPTAALLQSAARIGGIDRGLVSLEVRTSPDPAQSHLLQFVREVDGTALELQRRKAHKEQNPRNPSPFDVGIVFHFTKDRGGGAREGKPAAYGLESHANPFRDFPGYRYGDFFREKRTEAMSLVWVLRHYPLTLERVRGLDVCTDELGVPNWVLAPLFNYVREEAHRAADRLRRELGHEVPPLRTTAHAGEDFVHLLTGLRNLDEAIEHFNLAEGDRIGHGLSLGMDPQRWASRTGGLAIPREERLWDLVWVWTREGKMSGGQRYEARRNLEQELAELSYEIFQDKDGPPPTPHALAMLRQDLGDIRRLEEVGYPNNLRPPYWLSHMRRRDGTRLYPEENRNVLLYKYLTNPAIFHRGQELIRIDPSSEGGWLASLQADLRLKVGSLGIVVEVNPTSNLLIGDLGDLTAHPLWRLRPPRPLVDDVPPVSICIGSDDPITFASNLRQEYQLLSDAMILAGLSDEEARQWLERTRACGMESRFTVPRSRHAMLDLWTSDDAIPLPPLA